MSHHNFHYLLSSIHTFDCLLRQFPNHSKPRSSESPFSTSDISTCSNQSSLSIASFVPGQGLKAQSHLELNTPSMGRPASISRVYPLQSPEEMWLGVNHIGIIFLIDVIVLCHWDWWTWTRSPFSKSHFLVCAY